MAPLLRVALDGFLHSKLQHSVSGLVQPCSNVCFMHIEGPFWIWTIWIILERIWRYLEHF